VATATHLGDPLDPLTSLPTETLDLTGRTATELSRVRVFLTLSSQKRKITFYMEVILIEHCISMCTACLNIRNVGILPKK